MNHPSTETLAQIVLAQPAAARVFQRHHLDFCCHGQRPLDESCREAGVDPAEVQRELAAELEQLDSDVVRWDERPLPELVDHIVRRYHEPLHRDLVPLVDAARHVEQVHGDKASYPKGLADLLEDARLAIEDHLAKEERVLFPWIRSGRRPVPAMPVQAMMREHEDHGANLARLRRLTHDFAAPAEACTSWRTLYRELERLESELMEHIHLENHVLFPRALLA